MLEEQDSDSQQIWEIGKEKKTVQEEKGIDSLAVAHMRSIGVQWSCWKHGTPLSGGVQIKSEDTGS